MTTSNGQPLAQEAINIRASVQDPNETHAEVIRLAAETHAPYPQYIGHWNGPEWHLVVFRRRVTTKMGTAFEKGDVTLARHYVAEWDDKPHLSAYSIRNGIDTSVPPTAAREFLP